MSIHVCKCVHNGREEYHLRYPGMDEAQAQALADKINGGYLESGAFKKLPDQDMSQDPPCFLTNGEPTVKDHVPVPEPITQFEDARVQLVYDVLCNDEDWPNDPNEHWEGWVARRVVDRLFDNQKLIGFISGKDLANLTSGKFIHALVHGATKSTKGKDMVKVWASPSFLSEKYSTVSDIEVTFKYEDGSPVPKDKTLAYVATTSGSVAKVSVHLKADLEKAFLKLLEEYEGVMEEFEYRSCYDKMVGFANEARTTLSLPTFEGKAK